MVTGQDGSLRERAAGRLRAHRQRLTAGRAQLIDVLSVEAISSRGYEP